MGNEWIDLIPHQKESKEALIQTVNMWLDHSGKETLLSLLKLPSYPPNLDYLFSFLDAVKKLPRPAGYAPEIIASSAASTKDYPETNILIVGKSNWSGFFTDFRYRSLQLLLTEANLNLSLPMGKNAGNLMLPVAAHELGDKYRSGLWNTGYVPRMAVWDIVSKSGLPEPLSQLSYFRRHSAGPLSSNENEKFHDGYVFVHKRTDDRIRHRRKRRGGALSGT